MTKSSRHRPSAVRQLVCRRGDANGIQPGFAVRRAADGGMAIGRDELPRGRMPVGIDTSACFAVRTAGVADAVRAADGGSKGIMISSCTLRQRRTV